MPPHPHTQTKERHATKPHPTITVDSDPSTNVYHTQGAKKSVQDALSKHERVAFRILFNEDSEIVGEHPTQWVRKPLEDGRLPGRRKKGTYAGRLKFSSPLTSWGSVLHIPLHGKPMGGQKRTFIRDQWTLPLEYWRDCVCPGFLKNIFPLGDVDRLTGEHSVSGASMRKCCIIRLKYW
jgi:hypothetical protein